MSGTKEGIRSAPDGIFQPPAAPRVHEVLVQRAGNALGYPCHPRASGHHHQANQRPAAMSLLRSVRTWMHNGVNYSSSQVQIFPGDETGKLKIFPNAMARELITDGPGKVKAVSYVDKATRTEKQIRCRAVVVAASACESARLLLNSRGPGYTNGLGNSSGVVGRYLMDSVGYDVGGYVPALEGMQRHDTDGLGGGHLYMPWWVWTTRTRSSLAAITSRSAAAMACRVSELSTAPAKSTKATAGPEEVRSPKIWNYRRTIGSR